MADEWQPAAETRLKDAVIGGASVGAIEELLTGMPQEEVAAADESACTALHYAVDREAEVFQTVLDAMSKESIDFSVSISGDALSHALKQGNKEAVMAVRRRMEREEEERQRKREEELRKKKKRWMPRKKSGKKEEEEEEEGEWNPFAKMCRRCSKLYALFRGPLISDKEVVDLVASLVPVAYFSYDPLDPLSYALISPHPNAYAVSVCLSKIDMANRLKEKHPLRYVNDASTSCTLAVVQQLYELASLSSARAREDPTLFCSAMRGATKNREHGIAILEFLLEKGGKEALEACPLYMVTEMVTVEGVEWLLMQRPDILSECCRETPFLADWLMSAEEVRECLLEAVVETVDTKDIVNMLQFAEEAECMDADYAWMWELRTLHERVPECIEAVRWEWLLWAARDSRYRDVEYMLGYCSQEDLTKRDERGDRVSDVAERDPHFPRELLARLTVMAKNANS